MIVENLKELPDYNPEKVEDKVLFDDWRWILTFYSNLKQGKKMSFDEELIEKKALEILKELLKRIKSGVNYSFNLNNMKAYPRELLAICTEKLTEDERKILTSSISNSNLKERLDDKKLIEDYISNVGSLPNWGKTTGDLDIIIKEKDPEFFNLVKEKFSSQFDKSIKDRLSFHEEREPGVFTNHFHLYDLVIIKNFKENYMNVLPGGKGISDLVLDVEIFNNLKPILLVKDFIRFDGNKWFISFNKNSQIFYLITFNLFRAFPKEISNSFEYIEDFSQTGESVFDLFLMPKRLELHEMEAKIKLFKPIEQQKPTQGRYEGESYSNETLLKVVEKSWPDWKDTGLYVGIKRDGATTNIHWEKGKAKIFTEHGSDVSENLPTIIKELTERTDSGICIGELELYTDGVHQPRADSSAVMNNPSELEKYMRLTIYDIFNYNGKDLYELPYSDRREVLVKLNETKHVQVSQPEYLVFDEKDLTSAVEKSTSTRGSEGAMLKKADINYEFKERPSKPSMIKFKKEYQIIARVLSVEPVEGAEAWVYVVGIDEERKENEKKASGGIYLGEKHARMIYEGKKSAILKDREYPIMLAKAFWLAGDKIYGAIYPNSVDKISTLEDFNKTFDLHKITDEERKKWDWNFPLYMYKFKWIKLKKPRDYEHEKGVVNFIKEVKFK